MANSAPLTGRVDHAAGAEDVFELTICRTDEKHIDGHGDTPYRTSRTTWRNAAFSVTSPAPAAKLAGSVTIRPTTSFFAILFAGLHVTPGSSRPAFGRCRTCPR